MNKLREPPPLPPKRKRGGLLLRNWDREEETKSLVVGILLTLLLWPLLVGGFAWGLRHVDGALAAQINSAKHPRQFKELNIELAPDEQPAAKTPFKFVDTNPNAPDNEPAKTDNFAARNQQAAQPEPDKTTTGDHARLDGKDIPSQQVVVGQLAKPETPQPEPAPQPTPPSENTQNAPRKEQMPLPGFEKKDADNPDGIGSNIAAIAENHQPVAEEVKGVKEAPQNGLASGAQSARPQPRPRPRLQPQAPPGVLAKNIHGTSNVGAAAYDAKWNEFGDYMQQLVDIVREQWYRLIEESAVTPQPGSHVAVTFRINSKGEIAEIVNVEETAGKQGTYVCTSAITARQPYRAWTPQMVAVLGNEQVITFFFYYY